MIIRPQGFYLTSLVGWVMSLLVPCYSSHQPTSWPFNKCVGYWNVILNMNLCDRLVLFNASCHFIYLCVPYFLSCYLVLYITLFIYAWFAEDLIFWIILLSPGGLAGYFFPLNFPNE